MERDHGRHGAVTGGARPAEQDRRPPDDGHDGHNGRDGRDGNGARGRATGTMEHPGVGAMQGHAGMAHGEQAMPGGGHEQMMREQRRQRSWTYYATIMLGVWLLTSPAMADYGSTGLARGDLVTGLVIVALGCLALTERGDFWGRWGICVAGIWLLFAPLVFATPSAFVYANDTIVGVLAIAFTVLVPMMPGKAHHMAMMAPGPEIPPGWTYNPSSWFQRAPIIALAFISFFFARYMAAFQLGHISSVWEPFFSPGTAAILTSDVSRAWPISDAGLGATAYAIEMLSGFMGGRTRWRTMPWMVLMFGILVAPLGVTSIVLVILQPLSVGTWCTACLITALLMLVMIPLALDEVVAMGQFLVAARREGQPLWRTFWVGGALQVTTPDQRTPEFDAGPDKAAPATAWGVSVPWTLLLATAIGLWLMAAPAVFGSGGGAADSDHLVGALVAVTAVIALAEVARPVRFVNVLFGAWLIAAPWLLGGASAGATANDVIMGLALILLSIRRGPMKERYGSWNRLVV